MATDSARTGIRLSFCAITDVGRVRDNNEDAFVALDLDRNASFAESGKLATVDLGPRGVVIAVSDGMGGAQAGEVASALVLKSLEESLAASEGSIDEVLRQAVENANLAVFQAARDTTRKGMGATLTAVLLHGTSAYIAAVGDSRAYLKRGLRFRRMTRDQSYVQLLLDAGVLDTQEAERSPFKNVVLQSMGQKPDVQVALGRLELFRGDRLLLCSDGLTGHVADDDLALEFAHVGVPVDVLARTLVDKALEGGGEDNITVAVVELTGEGLARAEVPESVTQTFHVIQEFEANLGPTRPATSPGQTAGEAAQRRSSAPAPAADAVVGVPVASPSLRPPAPTAPIADTPGRTLAGVALAIAVGILLTVLVLILAR